MYRALYSMYSILFFLVDPKNCSSAATSSPTIHPYANTAYSSSTTTAPIPSSLRQHCSLISPQLVSSPFSRHHCSLLLRPLFSPLASDALFSSVISFSSLRVLLLTTHHPLHPVMLLTATHLLALFYVFFVAPNPACPLPLVWSLHL
jgi:hypothetical protein